uniref:Uncharacterized protein n=1 Tax=Siphoviridae sp. ctqwO1 TaxID=2826472 RepID=A0A8S5QMM5_9CAUD|nr:MAG TPA: hypothetical protein [Siphoviridae sp. ctqwO1]
MLPTLNRLSSPKRYHVLHELLYHLRRQRTSRTFVWLLFLYPILHIL